MTLTEEDGLPFNYVPKPLPPLKNGELMHSPGLAYFLGLEYAQYIAQENGVTIPDDQVSVPMSSSEQDKREITFNTLEKFIEEDIDCFTELPNGNTFCHYRGGQGNIVISKESTEGIVSGALVESKLSNSNSCALAQLQAFMLQCATKEIVQKLKEKPEEVKDLKTITCYGLTLVSLPPEPVNLLCLTIDFEAEQTAYELLSSVSDEINSFTFVDRAIKYIVSKM